MPTSICRSIVTICSGLYLWIGMTRFSSKWILSHSTWYKNRRVTSVANRGDAQPRLDGVTTLELGQFGNVNRLTQWL
jgi:hypothetical protein